MKDSILKGTGNSRFLKSAIPDGTTWAEALAMLRAGTFPMDLNGINNAGFQQVGTPLNKANLLKDVNALTLGLTGDPTPDNMFNVLAHAGDLHVWKKTTNGVVTYPISTNRNAYQEGSDAKPAGYTLGDVVTGSFVLSVKNNGSTSINWEYSDDITVSDAWMVELVNPYSATINAYGYASNAQLFRGKFVATAFEGTDFIPNTVCFIPAEANIAQSGDKLVVDRYQPVTGYAAIPANTTIEYLGCLGEKTRMQVVSYVGTGTYGESNAMSLTFNFAPRAVLFLGTDKDSTSVIVQNTTRAMIAALLTTNYRARTGFTLDFSRNPSYGKKSSDEKTFYWYNTYFDGGQFNVSGYTYYFIAIG